jgi:photosystem II stability/assembly factor-like uncharacterized protein
MKSVAVGIASPVPRIRSLRALRAAGALVALLCALMTVCAGPTTASPGFSYVDARHGWYVGGQNAYARIWRTNNGGRTVRLLPARFIGAGGGNAGVHFLTPKIGIWFGDLGELGVAGTSMQRTIDGGVHWSEVSWPGLVVADGVAFSDSTHGWASCYIPSFPPEGGQIAKTSDGGATWTTVRILEDSNCGELAGPTSDCCYATVYRSDWTWELWQTTNGGLAWAKRTLPGGAAEAPGSMAFPAVRTGWLAGGDGAIFKTNDGGQSWVKQASGTRRSLHDIEFVDSRYGWAVGERGTILATRDGGAHWRRQASGSKADLGSADFVDRLHGWVGDRIVRLCTTNGGKTWKKL